MQDIGEYVSEDHPLVTINQDFQGRLRIRPGLELSACSLDFKVEKIVLTTQIPVSLRLLDQLRVRQQLTNPFRSCRCTGRRHVV